MFSTTEIISILQWWLAFFVIGSVFLPMTVNIFRGFSDRGYLFSKVIGMALVSYTLLVLSILHILPFGLISIILILWIWAIINFVVFKKKFVVAKLPLKFIAFEEIIFLVGIFAWSFVRAHEPSINGLEKFMDFGFLNSILRSTYMPPTDMWFPPFAINYYYFGHLSTAVVTELSRLPSYVSFNLMIATLFSFCFSLSFSLGTNFISKILTKKSFVGGLLTAILITFAGNLHTIYAFFKPYNVDNPVPFWNLQFLPGSFPNAYWYPNATRFIPFTIHEFPLYSFVVSDLHGHVLDIPFVLLTIGITYMFFLQPTESISNFKIFKYKLKFLSFDPTIFALLGFMLAVMYMTNVWDGLIYMLLIFIILTVKNWQTLNLKKINYLNLKKLIVETAKPAITIIILFFIFSLPFNIFFKPFASGVGILCAPTFLTNIGRIGPLLFEANHCQKSTWWELLTLYGFFYFFVLSFVFFIIKLRNKLKLTQTDLFVLALIILSTVLITVPEFVYVKDIYPEHYRANTMFKLVYQAFMMLSITSGYIIVRILGKSRNIIFYFTTVILLGIVLVYPYFAIKSYYGDMKTYTGLDGIIYLKTRYPQDYDAINWINANISGRPVMVEAQGDSYTDYERISANTGLPTILGWTVHEWLWRGTYDVPAPRIAEVQNVYESSDINLTKSILKKYNAKYIYVGTLEHQKYPNLIESKFAKLGKVVWEENGTRIYKINN